MTGMPLPLASPPHIECCSQFLSHHLTPRQACMRGSLTLPAVRTLIDTCFLDPAAMIAEKGLHRKSNRCGTPRRLDCHACGQLSFFLDNAAQMDA
jgi:hypothetical protein